MGTPEPSEEDWEVTQDELDTFEQLGPIDSRHIRVIAHLIRNGAVLAKGVESSDRAFHIGMTDEERAAIALFERLKEVCGE